MDPTALQAKLDDIFDQALVYHGFTDYIRDYELFAYCTADPRTGIHPEHLRYLFKLCVQADVTTAVRPDVWAASLDDRLIEYSSGKDLPGYVWGVKWQVLYPGAQIVVDSERATEWSQKLGIDFHEVRIESNGSNLSLVFSDLEVTRVEPGYTPFKVPDGGPDFKIPLG